MDFTAFRIPPLERRIHRSDRQIEKDIRHIELNVIAHSAVIGTFQYSKRLMYVCTYNVLAVPIHIPIPIHST